MKLALAAVGLATLLATTAIAQDEGDIDIAITTRQGLMELMSRNLAVLGEMATGNTDYNAESAGTAARNLSVLASMLDPDMFPVGSEYRTIDYSYALPAIWSDQAGFVAKINALNDAADAMKSDAGKDLASLKAGMNGVGGACTACHRAYRQPED